MNNNQETNRQRPPKPMKKEVKKGKTWQRKHLFIAVGVLIAIIVGTIFFSIFMNYYTARNFLKEAKEFHERGDDYWAMQYATNSLIYDNEYGDAYLFKASLLLGWNNYEACADQMKSAIKYSEAPSADMHFIYGKCLYKLGEFDKAFPELLNIYKSAPARDSVSLYMGNMYMNQKLDYNAALKAYTFFFDRNKSNYNTALQIAECYFKLEKFNEAITFYNIVLKINSDNPDALYGLAKCYFADGNLSDKACETALLAFKYGSEKAAALLEAYCPNQVAAIERAKQ